MRLITDQRTQARAAQAAAALLLLVVAILLTTTLINNLARLNLTAGFGFLLRPAGMRMGESVLPFEPTDSFAWAMLAAAANTIRVAAAAIVLATILGTAIGVMRLSANPLLRTITTAYVELFRNTPLLLQILFWSAILLKLPGVKQAVSLGDWAYLSQRGLQVPALTLAPGALTLPILAAAAAAAVGTALLARRRGPLAAVLLGLFAAAVALLALLTADGALGLDRPTRKLFGYSGGLALTPEFCALLAGLTAYTAAFIAELVRGGILAVPRGQWEAARSVGLRDRTILRRVVLPQALRVVLPPLTSQWVAIIKNSSLAIAIGYPDLFWAVSTSINVTGHAIEGVAVLMLGYLALTLGTASTMNTWYRRLLRRGAAA